MSGGGQQLSDSRQFISITGNSLHSPREQPSTPSGLVCKAELTQMRQAWCKQWRADLRSPIYLTPQRCLANCWLFHVGSDLPIGVNICKNVCLQSLTPTSYQHDFRSILEPDILYRSVCFLCLQDCITHYCPCVCRCMRACAPGLKGKSSV